MRYGIIAEGIADVYVIRNILKYLLKVDSTDIFSIRPTEIFDETDVLKMRFSNWELVMRTCADTDVLSAFFDSFEEEGIIIVQIDTAERGETNYNIPLPIRTKDTDWMTYSETLRQAVKAKLETFIPSQYRYKMVYAVAIRETDAWLIPIFCKSDNDTSSLANPKERLQATIGSLGNKKKKFINTNKRHLDYQEIAKQFKRTLPDCRKANRSLDLFCTDLESISTKTNDQN